MMVRMSRSPVLRLLLFLALTLPVQPALGGEGDNCAVVPVEPARAIRVAAVGDIMMGTTFPEPILPPEDGATLFRSVAPLLAGHDVVFGNLEGPLTDVERSPKCPKPRRNGRPCFAFRTPPRYVRHLSEAGFTAVNVANNHSLDFGMEGLDNTLDVLDAAGVEAVGGERVAVFAISGRSVAVAGFSYSLPTRYVHPLLDVEAAREIVAGLKNEYDLVVVSFHGGAEGAQAVRVTDTEEEFLGENRGNVVRFARAAVDAGADLVLGHGPHVPRAIEVYRGKLIAYSLGNFAVYSMFNIKGLIAYSLGNFAVYSMFNLKGASGLGYALQAELDPETGGIVRFRTPSVTLRPLGIPQPDPSAQAEALLRKLSEEFLAGEPDAAERRETLSRLWN
ncbi:MAG: capsule biosynthesis protein [Deltaproteobacteria bacterium]|nr:capsule biosynthesis protein [Deltaproteobacteria bacterium]